ncbi:hypothetical protein C922_03816 [Plasmodium inui San Antonio 1]|uniref:DNA-directed primase/polymerase protein n=1 Tax=Plasmodium inui San Antonio 1 TaxID=1237626 RepID=W7A3B5_9APIC|nr:hypothetical protein C922_03816 [Plasmodium inui San Antonio 1]EUD65833.1 hypothetical protein C922_03816 [Plasmodium inui San Antonio 1]
MAMNAETFYGKRKREKPIFEVNIEKYGILKRLRRFDQSISQGVKKRWFYKQHEALSHYAQLVEVDLEAKADTDVETGRGAPRSRTACSRNGQGIIIYTEEIENGKRCFVLDSLYRFLQFYCLYALSLEDIYFDDGGAKDGKAHKLSLCKSAPCGSPPNEPLTGDPPPNDQPMHLYELILANEKRWLFFDLECDVLNGLQNKDCLLFIFLIELCLFVYTNFDVKICLNDAIILDSSTSEKISFHVIVKNIHFLPDEEDYYEYLKDYCHFFQNRLNKSDDFFYDKYKKRQTKFSGKMHQKKLLLFDNENSIKYFVDLFINHIARAIQDSENACVINLSTVYIGRQKGCALPSEDSANLCSLGRTKVEDRTNDTHEGSITGGGAANDTTRCNFKERCSNLSAPERDHHAGDFANPHSHNEPREKLVEEKTPLDMINDFSEIHDFVMAISGGEIPRDDSKCVIGRIIPSCQSISLCAGAPNKEGNKPRDIKEKRKNGSYFSMYTKSLNDIVQIYINKLENAKGDNCFDRSDDNFLILLFAMKRDESVDKPVEESVPPIDNRKEEPSAQKDIPPVEDTEYTSPGEEGNLQGDLQNEEKLFQMQRRTNDHHEMLLLKCIVDNSVYSRNRNFRMIFSSKKKKKNNRKLMLSRYNVKRYSKANVDSLILKSLVTFYQDSDASCQIGENVIFQTDDMKKFGQSDGQPLGSLHRFTCVCPHFASSRFSIGSARRSRNGATPVIKELSVHRRIQLHDINHAHVHTILRIIFFWNFELYKNFKKNKIYVNKFQGEISKEYFYRIVSIHNKLQYDLYRHGPSEGEVVPSEEYSGLGKASTEEVDKKSDTSREMRKNDHVSPLRKGIMTSQFCENLDTYDDLFLKNANFYSYVLDEYTKCTQIGKEKNDSLLLLIKYFLYSITYNAEEYILHFRENKFCKNKSRAHKSNHIYVVFNHLKNLFVQKCHDSDCSHFVSEIYYL